MAVSVEWFKKKCQMNFIGSSFSPNTSLFNINNAIIWKPKISPILCMSYLKCFLFKFTIIHVYRRLAFKPDECQNNKTKESYQLWYRTILSLLFRLTFTACGRQRLFGFPWQISCAIVQRCDLWQIAVFRNWLVTCLLLFYSRALMKTHKKCFDAKQNSTQLIDHACDQVSQGTIILILISRWDFREDWFELVLSTW